jgi:nicotinate-nucleotide adenylyltransferase
VSAPPATRRAEPSRLCLFGGSFDPVHLGHIAIAHAAVEALSLDQVRFLPARISPHKQNQRPAPPAHRLAMLELATAGLPWAATDRFDLDAPEPSYSWRTALAMRERFPDARLFWLVGGDQWRDLPTWARPDILAGTLEFIVVARGAEIQPRAGWTAHAMPPAHPASASQIRASAAAGHLRADWLAPAVAHYIRKHHLYQ